MFKLASIGCAAIAIAGMAFMSNAQASYASGTYVHSSVTYRAVHPVRNVTRYHSITHTRYVTHVTRVVNVTRTQPIHYVTNVTRYMHHTVVLNSSQYASRRAYGPTRYYRTSSEVAIGYPADYPSVHTVYRYHTINPVTYSTHVHNVPVTHYVHNIYRHVTVVRIEPIVYEHTVARIYTRTVARARTEYVNVAKVLPARTYTTAKVINIDP